MIHIAKTKPRPSRKLKYYLQGEKGEGKWVHYVNLPSKKQTAVEYKLRQQIKAFYGLTHTEYARLEREKGGILGKIESRIDVILCRIHVASSIFEARNILTQGIISINNQVCKYPNERVPLGGEIKVDLIKGAMLIYRAELSQYNIPKYLKLTSINSAILIMHPTVNMIPFPEHIEIQKLPGAY